MVCSQLWHSNAKEKSNATTRKLLPVGPVNSRIAAVRQRHSRWRLYFGERMAWQTKLAIYKRRTMLKSLKAI
jgi:hypothetical protein